MGSLPHSAPVRGRIVQSVEGLTRELWQADLATRRRWTPIEGRPERHRLLDARGIVHRILQRLTDLNYVKHYL